MNHFIQIKDFISLMEVTPLIYIPIYCACVLSTAASEVPQAAGGNPTVEGAPQPEGRARQTAGAGD